MALSRRTRVRPVSKKRARLLPKRRAFVRTFLAEHPFCAHPECWAAATECHEVVRRSQGGSITDAANVRGLCDRHHREVHARPAWAVELGLLERRWSK